MASPLIVTAELGAEVFSWLNDLRRQHYPAERNQVPAHLTLFHTLPPSSEREVRQLLAEIAVRPGFNAVVASVLNLGRGVAFKIASTELDQIRSELAHHLTGLLTAQDRAGWSAHVTVQNKVTPREAMVLIRTLGTQFDGRAVRIAGLGLHRYRGGPWETVRTFPFRR